MHPKHFTHGTFISSLTIKFTKPTPQDGHSVTQLVKNCPPLDTNSSYCNLLQCTHFSETSIIAKKETATIGFISGYQIPNAPHRLFIWQVAVSEEARGMGLASKMVTNLLERLNSSHNTIEYIETTITKSNEASWALFTRLSETLNAPLADKIFFDKELHFSGEHDSEHLVQIGPIQAHNQRTKD